MKPAAALPQFHELHAPTHWRCIDFISDLHLQASVPANFAAFQHYLETTPADAIFILGDLFEVWVGDDAADRPAAAGLGPSFEDQCRDVLQRCASRTTLFYIHGNRDFLIGQAFLRSSGMHGLPDPSVLVVGTQRYLLSHGDALCLTDVDYQTFRSQVRSPEWQSAFLARPLQERTDIARGLRAQSEARKQQGGPWIDLDPAQTVRWLDACRAQHMVHGHTHEGADHAITSRQGAGTRHVLCDWHAEATPPIAQVLRLRCATGSAITMQRLPVGTRGI